jgi:DNA ligase 1
MGQLIEAFKLIAELESVGGRNEKESIIEKGKDNETFKELFYYAYNPFLKYHIVNFSSEEGTEGGKVSDEHWTEFKGILKILNERRVTGGEAHAVVSHFFSKLTRAEYEIFKRVLKKDLKVGATAKTFNKIFKKHIPVFECMLAKEKIKVKKLPESVIVEPKLDGYRALGFVSGNEVELLTRNGKQILGFNAIEEDLKKLDDGIYDAEIVGKEDTFSEMQQSVFKKAGGKQGILNIFDYIPTNEFAEGKSSKKILDRKAQLEEIFERRGKGCITLKLVPYTQAVHPESEEIKTMYDEFLTEGYEGAMLKGSESYYECKRSSSWLKVVPFISVDLPIVDFDEGEEGDKYEGTLGAFVVEYKGNRVNVSGMSDALRDEVWENKSEYLGKIIEVHAREESRNKKGEVSLRFPRFKRFRPDKDQ